MEEVAVKTDAVMREAYCVYKEAESMLVVAERARLSKNEFIALSRDGRTDKDMSDAAWAKRDAKDGTRSALSRAKMILNMVEDLAKKAQEAVQAAEAAKAALE